ncbi:hypothetical protein GY45DRAFT_941661 [Cubamyces sp. BRFM 1775]|nr:hypothetical protein GY45DRAFT_941661 [Cubamyces sp. BRFM 1775]
MITRPVCVWRGRRPVRSSVVRRSSSVRAARPKIRPCGAARCACLSRSGLYWHRSVHRSDATGQLGSPSSRARKTEEGDWPATHAVLRLGRRHLPLCLRAFARSTRLGTMFWAGGLRVGRSGLDARFLGSGWGLWSRPRLRSRAGFLLLDAREGRTETIALPWNYRCRALGRSAP